MTLMLRKHMRAAVLFSLSFESRKSLLHPTPYFISYMEENQISIVVVEHPLATGLLKVLEAILAPVLIDWHKPSHLAAGATSTLRLSNAADPKPDSVDKVADTRISPRFFTASSTRTSRIWASLVTISTTGLAQWLRQHRQSLTRRLRPSSEVAPIQT